MQPTSTRPGPASSSADAGRRNLMLLVQLRWLAVGGQLATILATSHLLGVALPLQPMFSTLAILVMLNVVVLITRRRSQVTNLELFCTLLVDVTALTVQLYLSGGASNPFITIYFLQVVLGAVLLEAWSSWTLVAVTSTAFAALALVHRPLRLPPDYASILSPSFVLGSWFNFTLAAVLLVAFVTRIARNLRHRDAHLAAMRQRAAEEEQIVRMGLLASGAAHELGTPLASISVLLGDWKNEPGIATTPHLAAEVEEMRLEVARCKDILSGILFAAGEVTGVAPARTTLHRFLDGIVTGWSSTNPGRVSFDNRLGADVPIVADRALAQALTAVLDNAVEAQADAIHLVACEHDAQLTLQVGDDGPGFPDRIIANLGRPYQSSKSRKGAGLGLFLATNVLRTLGGTLSVRNRPSGGAEVTLSLPLAGLTLQEDA